MTNSDSDREEGGDQLPNNLFESATNGDIDLDEIMVITVNSGKSKGVNAARVSRI